MRSPLLRARTSGWSSRRIRVTCCANKTHPAAAGVHLAACCFHIALVERNHRDPLSVYFLVIQNFSAKPLGNIFWQQVAMVAEESGFDALPSCTILEQRMRRLILRGEDKCHVIFPASRRSQRNL